MIMSATIVDMAALPRIKDASGELVEVLNRETCGAEYAHGVLRFVESGRQFDAIAAKPMHQLIYVLQGAGVVRIDSAEYEVEKGGGVYLAPLETAKIGQKGTEPLKLFHLIVPQGEG
jgi:hypothetical protein